MSSNENVFKSPQTPEEKYTVNVDIAFDPYLFGQSGNQDVDFKRPKNPEKADREEDSRKRKMSNDANDEAPKILLYSKDAHEQIKGESLTEGILEYDSSSSDDGSCYILTVSGLPESWNLVEIKDYVKDKCGLVENIKMLKNMDSNSCGAICMYFDDSEKCKQVMEKLQDADVDGEKLAVEMKEQSYEETEETDTKHQQEKPEEDTKDMHSKNVQDSFEDSQLSAWGLKEQVLKNLGIKGPIDQWVHVTNFRCDKSELKEVLELAGHVLMCCVMNTPIKYANVMYSHPLEAVQAVSMLNDQILYGQKLVVSLERPPPNSVIIPSGLKGIGPGLGINGRPVQNIFREYKRFLKKQDTLINVALFQNIDDSFDEESVVQNTPLESDQSDNEIHSNKHIVVKPQESIESLKAVDDQKHNTPYKIMNIKELSHIERDKSPNITNPNNLKATSTVTPTNEVQVSSSHSLKTQNLSESPLHVNLQRDSSVRFRSFDPNHNQSQPSNEQREPPQVRLLPRYVPMGPPLPIRPPIFRQQSLASRPSSYTGPPVRLQTQGPYVSQRSTSPAQYQYQRSPVQMQPPLCTGTPGVFGLRPIVNTGHSGLQGPSTNPVRPSGPPINTSFPSRPQLNTFNSSNNRGSQPSYNRNDCIPFPPKRLAPSEPSESGHSRSSLLKHQTVQVNNLPPSVTLVVVCEKFSQCGQVTSVQFIRPGCALVKFAERSQAERSIQLFNKNLVEGNIIDVQFI